MGWKPGNSKHDRKFMLARGSVLDWESGRNRPSTSIAFWGEWEGPSVFWKLEHPPGKPKPSIIHAPFRPAKRPIEPIQNTDPMVFGDAFIYSNCLQHAYASLRSLEPGSIVLFGRHSRVDGQRSFSLDTCLVIERAGTLAPRDAATQSYGADLLTDAVLAPLQTEGAVGTLTVYFGRGRSDNSTEPFSFFPAREANGSLPLFARPRLSPARALAGVISPDNMQGINNSSVSVSSRDEIWAEVVSQVTEQGCGLGYHAAPPPFLDRTVAELAARGVPTPMLEDVPTA